MLGERTGGALSLFPACLAGPNITVELRSGHVFLKCQNVKLETQNVTWSKDGRPLQQGKGSVLDVGAVLDDPRGSYDCWSDQSRKGSLQVFFRSA